MVRNRFFALLTVLCMLIGMVPVHAHASHADPLDALYHTRHQWDATHQIQADSRGKLLVRSADQAVLPAGDDEFLVSNTLEDNCRWGIADDGFLYIWCEGEMPTREAGQYPWSVYKELYDSLYIDSATVADNAFAGCDNLIVVILEESATAIGQNAFAGCTALEEFWFYGTAPSIADNAFSGTETHVVYHFNDTSFDSVRDQDFGGDLTWTSWVEAVDSGMFGTVEWTVYEDMSLSLRGTGSPMQDMASAEEYPWSSWQDEITYVACIGVTRLGNYALADFTALTYAYFDQTLTAIGNGAFQGCDGMTLSFAGNAPTLGVDVFSSDDLFLDYPQDDPTWTEEVIDRFYGIEPGDNELPPVDIPPEDDPPQNTTCGITAQQVYDAMMALEPQYPEGMHWTNDDYYAWNGGYFTGGYGCAGFAFILSDAAFGTEPCRIIDDDVTIADIRVGDILRINNDTHSVIVLEVHADHVVIAEGNFNSSIHWGRTLSADTIASTTDYIMTRYPEHSWSTGSCLEPRTCLNCGYAAEAPGHTWLVASCTAPRTCSVCGFSEGEPAGHTYTDDTDNSCNVCGFLRDVTQQPAVTVPLSAFELEVLRLTNLERLAAGLTPLTATEALQLATDIRADEVKAYFNHTRPNGTSCFTVLDELGIPYYTAAENIASGYQTPAAVVAGWMNSAGHRKNIMNSALGHMGVGESDRAWVQLFTDAPAYTAIRVEVPEGTVIEPGTAIDDMGLVAVLRNSNGDCWLPLASAFCTGYDPNAGGTQTVTVSVLGVTCTFTLSTEGHTHTWVEATCETPRTCSSCGKADGAPLGHNWQAATCEAPKTCATCAKTEGTALGHDWQAATCEAPKACATCGMTEGTPLGHNWQAATCEAPKTCATCAKTEGTALGHDWSTASCEIPGTCRRCGATTGGALGHNWQAATCEAPKTCSVCGLTDGAPLGHSWQAATCEAPKACATCGMTEGTALGHDWVDATCVKPRFCNRCGSIGDGSFGDHSWIAATCQTPKTCSVCGKHEGEPTAHNWDSGTVTLEPTPEADGLKTYTCQSCGATQAEPIPPTLAPFVSIGQPDTVASKHGFSYEIPQDGATVLIFFSSQCGKSISLMSALNDCPWLANPWLNVVAVESNIGTEDAIAEFRDTYTPDAADCIHYMGTTNNYLLFDYFHLFSNANTLTWPLVLVITGSAESPVVRFGSDAMTDPAKLEEALRYVSPAFAGWDGTVHLHTWVEATCQAPKTCSECGMTEGAPLEHIWTPANCVTAATCSACGEIQGTALGHAWVDATCQTPKTCSRCAVTEGLTTPHDFREGKCTMCGVAEMMQGDANGNGTLDYDDAVKVLRASISLETLSDEVALSCDVNGNGVLDFDDALLILRASIGLITEFPKAN